MLQTVSFQWQRDPRNPILAPNPASAYDSQRCMNPCVIRVGDQYRMYYSGGDAEARQRICLATAPVPAPACFTRHGPILELGAPGSFDAHWCVLPHVRRFGNRWHLYYSGHDGGNQGLQSFRGIGLAIGADGIHFGKYSTDPIITGDQIASYPNNRGIAGGMLVEDRRPRQPAGYRMYYTLAIGVPSPDRKTDQEKHCAVCHSTDGVHWRDHRIIMSPRREVASENIAVAAPFVWKDGSVFRMLYSGIGTRWSCYSIAEAVSIDGYLWHRNDGDAAVSLAPGAPGSWESEMVEYPFVLEESGRLRLYYCGNGFGATGIGTAVAVKA